jgi:hypothetical protein
VISSRVVRCAGLAIGATAVLFALLPFTTSYTLLDVSGPYPSTSVSCGPPVVEATHSQPRNSGWFGYAPLTSTPYGFQAHPCYAPARDRLVLSTVGLFAAVLLGWFAARIDRRDRRISHLRTTG